MHKAFTRLCYRTTRALLICKGLVQQGQSIYEAQVERGEDLSMEHVPIDFRSVLGYLASEVGAVPTSPLDPGLTEDQIAKVALSHLQTAERLGFDPENQMMHWLQVERITTFFPPMARLLDFELELLERAGRRLMRTGKMGAALYLKKILGEPSMHERRDWNSLSMALLRDFTANSMEDDRLLMVARLEALAARAEKSLDLRTYLATLREIGRVQGLTFLDDTASQKDLLALYSQRSNGRTGARIPQLPATAQAPAPRALPGP